MSPCIPSKPRGECELCMRHWPATTHQRRRGRVIAIDASALKSKGVCLMLVQRSLP